MKKGLAIALLFAAACSAYAGVYVTKPVLVATGDSYTRRTACSSPNYDTCDISGYISHESSYATYLNALTKYQVTLSDNSARGGETCTQQESFSSGPWVGEYRGLGNQVYERISSRPGDVVSILLGINDVNSYNVSYEDLKECLLGLYENVAVVNNRKVVAMTYPPINPSTELWKGKTSGNVASQNVSFINAAIRQAVVAHNQKYKGNKVFLAETSQAWTSSQVLNYTLPYFLFDNVKVTEGDGTYVTDGAHPNEKGARRLGVVWFDSVCGSGYLNCAGR